MIIDHHTLPSDAETLYQLNMDEQFRTTCDRFIRAEAERNAILRMNAELIRSNEELIAEVARLTAHLEALEAADVK